jgi:hypothetical protein
MATKNGLVESLVMSETATAPPSAGASDAGASEAGASDAAGADAAADDSSDEEPELQAARVTEAMPATAMAVKARPRVKRLIMWCPFEGWVGCDPRVACHVYS